MSLRVTQCRSNLSRNGKIGKLGHTGLDPLPSDSLPPEGGHVFPPPSMGEGQGEGVGADSFSAFP
jgi:hypothetical protein